MVKQELIWHIMLDEEERGPLTTDQVQQFIKDGTLNGNTPIWRPGFSEWQSIKELLEFWVPRQQASISKSVRDINVSRPSSREVVDHYEVDMPSEIEKFSLWRSANIGLLLSAVTLISQVITEHGLQLADYANTASGATIGSLIGQILGGPLFFVLVAAILNRIRSPQKKSKRSALWGAITFAALFTLILGAVIVYGKMYFLSDKIVTGESRKTFIDNMDRSCIQKQESLGSKYTEVDIKKYCSCVSEKVANQTTYRQLGKEPDQKALYDLIQRVEAAGRDCQ